MEFKEPYLLAMRDRAPKMFMQLRRSGMLDQHLDQMSGQAHEMLAQLLAQEPKGKNGLPLNPAALREAEEIVRATLIEFPTPEKEQRLEPPDDLPPMRKSAARTTGSNRAR